MLSEQCLSKSVLLSEIIHIESLKFRWAARQPDVLHVPALSVKVGQFVSIVGASGCGKSTLLRLIAGLIAPASGVIQTNPTLANASGTPSPGRRSTCDFSIVFQSPTLVPWRTAWQNIRLPSELGTHSSAWSRQTPSADDPAENLRNHGVTDDTIRTALKLVGLTDADAAKRPAQLSGGMQMRVALARAIVMNPAVLLMDEPFAALDDLLRMQLETEVRGIHDAQKLTTILVTHNISEAVFMSDRILVLGNQPSRIVDDIEITFPDHPIRDHALRSSPELHRTTDLVTERLFATRRTDD